MRNPVILPVVVGRKMTADCIASLRAQDIPCDLIVIDNGSTDGCGPFLRTLPDITLVSYTKRRSLNKVWNTFLGYLFDEKHHEYVLVLNNDTVLLPETFRLLRDDGGLFVTGVGTAPDQPLVIGDLSQRRPHPDFSCFLMRRECWGRVGPFDEQINAYTGDSDYHLRMEKAGIKAWSLQVPFAHIASGTIKHVNDQVRDEINKEAEEDRAYFVKKYGFTPGSPEYNEEFKK